MSFEDFYKEENDDSNRRGRLVIIAILLLPFGFFAFQILTNFIQPRYPQPNPIASLSDDDEKRRRANDEKLKRLDTLCASLPKPEDFVLVSSGKPETYSRIDSVLYTYRSTRATEEVFPVFIVWFSANGWTDRKSYNQKIQFGKGNQEISISRDVTTEGAFYEIYCSE